MIIQPDFTVYSVGLVYMSVCAISSLSIKEIEKRANMACMTGLDHGWTLDDNSFKNGYPNPCGCDTNPDTHKHYLLSC